MSAMGVIMLPSTALRQSSSEKPLKSPGGGPPALLMRMSGFGHAASSALRPASVVTSHTTGITFTPAEASSFAVTLSASAPRAQIVTSTPSRASAFAQPLPRPLEAAQTMAFLPLMPKSMYVSSDGAEGVRPLAVAVWFCAILYDKTADHRRHH